MQRAPASRAITEATRRAGHIRRLPPTDEIDVHVGERLRTRRIELGLSQVAVSRHLGLTFSQIQKYEKGSNRIGAGRLYHLAALLGVQVSYFFTGLESPRAGAASEVEPVASAEEARLYEAFARISDPHARQALLALAATMVDAD